MLITNPSSPWETNNFRSTTAPSDQIQKKPENGITAASYNAKNVTMKPPTTYIGFGITPDTKLYRATRKKYVDIEKMTAFANSKSMALIEDVYSKKTPRPGIRAKELEDPSLNVMTSQKNPYNHDSEDLIHFAITAGDVIEQGGKFYRDLTTPRMDCFIVTIPKGEIRCEIISRADSGLAEDKSGTPDCRTPDEDGLTTKIRQPSLSEKAATNNENNPTEEEFCWI